MCGNHFIRYPVFSCISNHIVHFKLTYYYMPNTSQQSWKNVVKCNICNSDVKRKNKIGQYLSLPILSSLLNLLKAFSISVADF